MSNSNHTTEFQEAARAAGIEMPETPEADGKIHRYHVEGDSRGSRNAWYAIYEEPIAAGAFGCWKRGLNEKWRSGDYEKLDEAERQRVDKRLKEARARAEAERQKCQATAAHEASEIVARAVAADPEHPYLKKKQIAAHGLIQESGKLIIPVRDDNGKITSVQFIDGEGEKRFLKDGRVSGGSFTLGEIEPGSDIIVCEGVATGATIHEATGSPVVCAFNAGNLKAVGIALHKRYPDARIIICADDDAWDRSGMPRPASKNIGRVKAQQAADACGALVVYPEFAPPGPGLTDFNDIGCQAGADAVRDQIEAGVSREMTLRRALALDGAGYEAKRTTIAAELGMRVTALDELRKNHLAGDPASTEGGDGEKPDQSMVDMLVMIGRGAELFHTPDEKPFARFESKGHREIHPLRSSAISGWLRNELYSRIERGVSDTTLKTAVETLAAIAIFQGERHEVHLRTARRDDTIFIDLCDTGWRCIEVTPAGWRVTDDPAVRFTRKAGMMALPEPLHGGSLDPVLDLLNINVDERVLIAGYLLSSLRGVGPYFPLNLHGPEGSAKSSATRIVRNLIDPSETPVASFPKTEENLAISAAGQLVVTFENVSELSCAQSDWLCRLATGGAFKTRTFFTNEEETILKFHRPSILNGIPNVVARGDLASRTISVELQAIGEHDRREESDIYRAFDEAHPGALGAVCDALSMALGQEAAIKAEFKGRLPRMADAAVFATAGEEALGFRRGKFLQRLQSASVESLQELAENDPVIPIIVLLLDDRGRWEGTHAVLLDKLRDRASEPLTKSRSFPKDATRLSKHIRRNEKLLGVSGITIERPKSRSGGHRVIVLEKIAELASRSVPSPEDTTIQGESGTLRDAGDATHTGSRDARDARDARKSTRPERVEEQITLI